MRTIKEYEKTQDSWEELLKPKKRVLGILPPKKDLPTQLMRKVNQEPYLLAEREVSQLFELGNMIDANNEELKKIRETRKKFNFELREMYPSLDWEQDKEELKIKSERLGSLKGMDRVLPKQAIERREKKKLKDNSE
jgi:hypothetical protein